MIHKVRLIKNIKMNIFNNESFNSGSNRIDSFDNLNDEKEELYFNNYNFNKGIEADLMTDNNRLFFIETSLTSNNMLSPVGLNLTKNINEMNPPNINKKEDEKIQKDKYLFTHKKRKSVNKNEDSFIFKKCGRKAKESKEPGFHNKYSDDNITRKIKSKTFKKIINYINSIINNKKKKKLLYLSSFQVKKSKVDYNKKLLSKTLEEILSNNISGKYTNYEPQHNKYIIEELLKEEDKEKRIFYKSLFNLTLLDCIKHLRRDIFIKELKGLGTLDDMIQEFHEEIEYKKMFRYYFLNFEKKINEKKGRNRKI